MKSQCIICNRTALISIPGSTEPIPICDTCTTNPSPLLPPEIIKKINQQVSFETFQYLLSQIKENKRLITLLTSQSHQLTQIDHDTKHNTIPVLQSQIVSLQKTISDQSLEIKSLKSQIQDQQSQIEESVTLKSLQEIILESMPSTETVEDNTDQIIVSIDTLQKTINKVLTILETSPEPIPKKQPLPVKQKSPDAPIPKTPDIPELDYTPGE